MRYKTFPTSDRYQGLRVIRHLKPLAFFFSLLLAPFIRISAHPVVTVSFVLSLRFRSATGGTAS
jgi:hypothetical protein